MKLIISVEVPGAKANGAGMAKALKQVENVTTAITEQTVPRGGTHVSGELTPKGRSTAVVGWEVFDDEGEKLIEAEAEEAEEEESEDEDEDEDEEE